jgi:hypothetical protein
MGTGHMRSKLVTLATMLSVSTAAVMSFTIACSPSSAHSLGSDCATAGGRCAVGPPTTCVKQAPSSAQDCSSGGLTPAEVYCCLEFGDGGTD